MGDPPGRLDLRPPSLDLRPPNVVGRRTGGVQTTRPFSVYPYGVPKLMHFHTKERNRRRDAPVSALHSRHWRHARIEDHLRPHHSRGQVPELTTESIDRLPKHARRETGPPSRRDSDLRRRACTKPAPLVLDCLSDSAQSRYCTVERSSVDCTVRLHSSD